MTRLTLRMLRKREQDRLAPKKLPIAEIARVVGVHPSTWYNWERSHFKDPGFKAGQKIIEILNCTAQELYEAIDPTEKYTKEFEYNGETYIRCTLLVQMPVFELIEAWTAYVEYIGTYTNKEIEPRRKGKGVELAVAQAAALSTEFGDFYEHFVKDR